jgi:5-methylcytosine-specific restriction endonuclease McrA
MTTLYCVGHGDYSDYGIQGIFDDKKKAKKYQAFYQYDHLEEYDLNPETPSAPRGDCYCLTYKWAENTSLNRVSNKSNVVGWEAYTRVTQGETPQDIRCYFFARDVKHSWKIAGDKLSALKAGSTHFTSFSHTRADQGMPYSSWVENMHTWRLDGKNAILLHTVEVDE